MDKQQRIGEIDGMLKYLRANPDAENAGIIRGQIMAERVRIAQQPNFARVLADIREADAEEALNMPPRLTIQQVIAHVRQLFNDCDGDSSVQLQECLEALEKDRKAIEVI